MIDLTPGIVEWLVTAGESLGVVFMRRLPLEDALGQLLCAFAQSEGGVLLVGVGGNRSIIGVPDAEVERTLERLISVARCVAPSNARVGVVEVEGRNVVYAAIGRQVIHLVSPPWRADTVN